MRGHIRRCTARPPDGADGCVQLAARKAADDDRLAAASPPGGASADHLDPDWRRVLPQRLDELAEAWRDPAAWQGMTEAGGLEMPGEVTGAVATNELLIHGWDLARATGQPYDVEETGGAGQEGLSGPVVNVRADAPAARPHPRPQRP